MVGALLPIVGLVLTGLVAPATADSGNGNGHQSGVIYSSLVTPLPGNLVSLGFESSATNEFGNAVTFSAGTSRELSKVVITMSSWACAAGNWSAHTCSTPEDATFSQQITLNIYSPSIDGVNPGAKIASITKTFNIDYRPSASTLCTDKNAGKWYDDSSKTCFNGLAQNITFKLDKVKVLGGAIFGISYNTSHYGYAPIGQSAPCYATTAGCGYDSLNVALAEDPTNVTVGTSVVPGKLWLSSPAASQYADNGAAGVGTFRIDSPNVPAWWGITDPFTSAPWYVPAIQVYAGNGGEDQKQNESKPTSTRGNDNQSDSRKGIKND
jgi:hypothetical protein